MRNTTYLKQKSKHHLITQLSPFSYRLTSGSSGNQYIINLTKTGATCSCPWGLTRPNNDKRSLCSHSLAILNYVKGMEEERTVNVTNDAGKSKRQVVGNWDGTTIVARKA